MHFKKIEEVKNPTIGLKYWVKCCLVKWGRKPAWIPVYGTLHSDKGHGLEKPHYHRDWRFHTKKMIEEQDLVNFHYGGLRNGHLLSPVVKNEILNERYVLLEYKHTFRDFPNPSHKYSFHSIVEEFKCNGKKMKNMICPHKGANLSNLEIKNDVVECPCHGLKWNVLTGELAN